MTKLQDLGAVYVDISDGENPLVRYIILDEQGKEIHLPSLDSALSTIEEIQGCMAWEEKHLKENIALQKKNYLNKQKD